MYSKPVILAGTGLNAQVIDGFLRECFGVRAVAFTVDGSHIASDSFLDRPLVALERVAEIFPPESHVAVNCIGYNGMNRVRGRISAALHDAGYTLPGFVHPSASIGHGTMIGRNPIVAQGVLIEPCSRIGDDVVFWTGAYLGHHSTVADRVYFGPRAAVAGTVDIGANAFIGANATVRSKTAVGEFCLIGAAAYVGRDLPARSVVRPPRSTVEHDASDAFDRFH